MSVGETRGIDRFPELAEFVDEHGVREAIDSDLAKNSLWQLEPFMLGMDSPIADIDRDGARYQALVLGYFDHVFPERDLHAVREVIVIPEGSRGILGYRPRDVEQEQYQVHEGRGGLRTVGWVGGLAVQPVLKNTAPPFIDGGKFFSFVNTGKGSLTVSTLREAPLSLGAASKNIPLVPGQEILEYGELTIKVPVEFLARFTE